MTDFSKLTQTEKVEHWKETESLILKAIELILKDHPSCDFQPENDFLKNNELGLAFEGVVGSILENNLTVPEKVLKLLEQAGQRMEYHKSADPGAYSFWQELEALIKKISSSA